MTHYIDDNVEPLVDTSHLRAGPRAKGMGGAGRLGLGVQSLFYFAGRRHSAARAMRRMSVKTLAA